MFIKVREFSKVTYYKIGKVKFKLRANILSVILNRFQSFIDVHD